MNNIKRSELLVNAAEESLAQANFSIARSSWNLGIRRCQESVELALSGILALNGVDYPKDHDQAPLTVTVLKANNVPLHCITEKELLTISIDLSRKRGPALHQEEGFDKETAKKAYEDAERVLLMVQTARDFCLSKYVNKK